MNAPIISDVYVINLLHCKNRIAQFDKHMRSNGISYKIWDAIDGRHLSQSYIDSVSGLLCNKILCTRGLIGCHLSHLTLWQHILDTYSITYNTNQWFMIFEDDITTKPGFVTAIRAIIQDLDTHNPVWHNNKYPDFIHLGCALLCANPLLQVTDNLFKSTLVTGMTAYMVSLSGIKNILSYMQSTVKFHIDVVLTLHQLFHNRLSYYSTRNLISHDDNGISTNSINTYPKLPAIIVRYVSPMTHAISNSTIFTIVKTSFNIWILPYIIIVIALLVSKRYFWLFCISCVVVISELLITLFTRYNGLYNDVTC